MSSSVATAALAVFTGLWPFGGADDPAEHKPTLAELEANRPRVELRADAAASGRLEADAGLAIRRYRELLQLEGVPPAMRQQALRRLADLELENGLALQASLEDEARALDYIEGAAARYEELLAAPADSPADASAGTAASSTSRPRADADADAVAAEDADRVRYQLARALDALGRSDASLAQLGRLVRDHPDSRYGAEAQFRRGERLFVEGRYPEAEAAYGAVLAHSGAARFEEQALYKLGWTRYRMAEHEASMNAFLALLERRFDADPDPDLDALGRAERELYEDTLRAVGLGFAQLDGWRSLDAELMTRGELSWAHLLYSALGGLYVVQERWRDAAQTFGAFVDRYPTRIRAPLFQQAVIDAYIEAGFPSLVLEARETFVMRHGLDAAFWEGRDPADHPEVLEPLRAHLADLARHDHARAQALALSVDPDASDSPEPSTDAPPGAAAPDPLAPAAVQAAIAEHRVRAVRWYRNLLDWFPADPEAGAHAFLLAEVLNESGRLDEAARAYAVAAYEHGSHPQAAEAGYAALLTARRHAATLSGGDRTRWDAEANVQSLRFATTFPDHEQAIAVLVALAETHFAAQAFDDAIAVAERVVTHMPPPDADANRVALTVIAHARFDLERYAQAELTYLRLRELDPDEASRAELDRRIAIAIYRQGEAAREQGDVDAAVGHFVRLGTVVPSAAEAGNALYDAGALLVSVERWSEAAPLLEQFRSAYAGHALAVDATRLLATALREDDRPTAAAREFERVANAGALDAAVRREALWEAARLHALAGSDPDQRRVLMEILERWQEPVEDALEARHQLAELAPDAAERRRWQDQIIAVDQALGAARTDRSRWLAAHAVLERAEPLRRAFAEVRLVAPLRDNLRIKRERMETALDAYADAAEYGVTEVVTAATWQIGEIYYQLSRDLLDSERPAGLADDALAQYELLLEEQAFPFEEQALDVYGTNAARTRDGHYDKWIRASFDRLATIAPARWARTERSDQLAIVLHE